MSRTTVGSSDRTPCKHRLMNGVFGREISALRRLACDGAYWLDLTAGNGVPLFEDWADPKDHFWHRACSPGILAYHAQFSGYDKPVYVDLCEKAAATYENLLGNLADNLPGLNYVRTAEDKWQAHSGRVKLRARNIDSTQIERLDGVPPTWAVQIANDPNKVTDWAMNPNLLRNASDGRWTCLGMSTMGCNPNGIKAWNGPEERAVWYQHVRAQADGLHRHHDLLLAAIENDKAQWAYLVTAPQKWTEEVEKEAHNAFERGGMSLRCEWLRQEPESFRDLLDVLFKTKKERGA